MDEMASRLAAAERERDTIEQQRRTLAMQLRSVSDGQASERAAASARAEQTQRQLRRLEEETGSLRQERARLLGQVAELEQQLHASQTELRQLRHMSAEEKRIADEASSAQVASLQHQLSDARALHDQSASEVEELLRSQEDLAGRYRDEAKRLAERSESLVNELRAESERLTVRNAELAAQLAQQHRLTDSLERSERERSAQLVLAQQKLKETTLLRSQQSARLAQLQAAEAAWQTERKVLLRQARADHAAATATLAPPRASAALALADAGQVGATSASVRRKAARDIKATAALEVEQALAAARLAQRQPPAVTAE
jgi:chromosome segregation ATPase